MLELDDSQLTDKDRNFLQEWADSLKVSVAELLGRIVSAAIQGERYVERIPS